MAIINENSANLLLPTNPFNNISSARLQTDDEKIRFITQLATIMNQNNIATNQKDIGIYSRKETINGQQFFNNGVSAGTPGSFVSVYRQCIDFGALPNAGVKTVAININPTVNFNITRIYGAASDTAGFNYIPLPFASPTLNLNISLEIVPSGGGPVIQVTTGVNRTNYDTCYIIVEYITT